MGTDKKDRQERPAAQPVAAIRVGTAALKRVLAGRRGDHDYGPLRFLDAVLECAARGDKTLGALTEAGDVAATELCSTHGA